MHYDVVMVFPERCYVKSVSIEQQLGRIEFISVDVMEDAVVSSSKPLSLAFICRLVTGNVSYALRHIGD